MPRKGSKTFTVTEEKHKQAVEICKKLGITLKEYIESLIGSIPPKYDQSALASQSIEAIPQIEGDR